MTTAIRPSDLGRDDDPVAPPPRRPLTPLQKWRFKRDTVILAAHRQGCSERLIAEAFDLPRARVHVVIRQMEARVGGH